MSERKGRVLFCCDAHGYVMFAAIDDDNDPFDCDAVVFARLNH